MKSVFIAIFALAATPALSQTFCRIPPTAVGGGGLNPPPANIDGRFHQHLLATKSPGLFLLRRLH